MPSSEHTDDLFAAIVANQFDPDVLHREEAAVRDVAWKEDRAAREAFLSSPERQRNDAATLRDVYLRMAGECDEQAAACRERAAELEERWDLD